VEKLLQYLKTKISQKFTGKVEINFFEGGVANINEHKSIKLNK
tara:strand:+ start:198 stop:326 length:129 start_codon:yes stop_codon:yes gene_type:complete